MDDETAKRFIALLTGKSWTEKDLEERVYPHLNGKSPEKEPTAELKSEAKLDAPEVEKPPVPAASGSKETVEGIRVLSDLFPVR